VGKELAVLAYRRSACLLAVAAVLALAQHGCAAGGAPTSTPASAAGSAPEPTSSASPSSTPDDPLSGRRQVNLVPLDKGKEVPGSVLAVTQSGRVQVTPGRGDSALFVPVRTGDGYLIKVGTPRRGGEASCLKVRSNGENPLTVVASACDAGDDTQLFTFDDNGKDGQGRAAYGIRNRDAFLQWRRTGGHGLIVEELGDSPLETTFVLVDRGPSTVPSD
jgi:hypothetical protein